eukprot:245393-Prorocentrum_lima.AAC.1
MTSSLVGSEMCIRDSLQHDSLPDNAIPVSSLSITTSPGLHQQLECQTTCLLYTSDAADDM